MILLRKKMNRTGKSDRATRSALVLLCVMAGCLLVSCTSAEEQAGDGVRQDDPSMTTVVSGDDGSTDVADAAGSSDPAGSIDELEVATDDPGTLDPVDLDADAPFGNGVVARIVAIESTEVTPALPGEIGGPAVVLDVEIANGSDSTVSLDGVTVDLVDLTGAPLLPVTTDPAEPLFGPLEPAAVSSGRYVFSVPVDDRDNVRLTIKYSGDTPAVALTGSLPND